MPDTRIRGLGAIAPVINTNTTAASTSNVANININATATAKRHSKLSHKPSSSTSSSLSLSRRSRPSSIAPSVSSSSHSLSHSHSHSGSHSRSSSQVHSSGHSRSSSQVLSISIGQALSLPPIQGPSSSTCTSPSASTSTAAASGATRVGVSSSPASPVLSRRPSLLRQPSLPLLGENSVLTHSHTHSPSQSSHSRNITHTSALSHSSLHSSGLSHSSLHSSGLSHSSLHSLISQASLIPPVPSVSRSRAASNASVHFVDHHHTPHHTQQHQHHVIASSSQHHVTASSPPNPLSPLPPSSPPTRRQSRAASTLFSFSNSVGQLSELGRDDHHHHHTHQYQQHQHGVNGMDDGGVDGDEDNAMGGNGGLRNAVYIDSEEVRERLDRLLGVQMEKGRVFSVGEGGDEDEETEESEERVEDVGGEEGEDREREEWVDQLTPGADDEFDHTSGMGMGVHETPKKKTTKNVVPPNTPAIGFNGSKSAHTWYQNSYASSSQVYLGSGGVSEEGHSSSQSHVQRPSVSSSISPLLGRIPTRPPPAPPLELDDVPRSTPTTEDSSPVELEEQMVFSKRPDLSDDDEEEEFDVGVKRTSRVATCVYDEEDEVDVYRRYYEGSSEGDEGERRKEVEGGVYGGRTMEGAVSRWSLTSSVMVEREREPVTPASTLPSSKGGRSRSGSTSALAALGVFAKEGEKEKEKELLKEKKRSRLVSFISRLSVGNALSSSSTTTTTTTTSQTLTVGSTRAKRLSAASFAAPSMPLPLLPTDARDVYVPPSTSTLLPSAPIITYDKPSKKPAQLRLDVEARHHNVHDVVALNGEVSGTWTPSSSSAGMLNSAPGSPTVRGRVTFKESLPNASGSVSRKSSVSNLSKVSLPKANAVYPPLPISPTSPTMSMGLMTSPSQSSMALSMSPVHSTIPMPPTPMSPSSVPMPMSPKSPVSLRSMTSMEMELTPQAQELSHSNNPPHAPFMQKEGYGAERPTRPRASSAADLLMMMRPRPSVVGLMERAQQQHRERERGYYYTQAHSQPQPMQQVQPQQVQPMQQVQHDEYGVELTGEMRKWGLGMGRDGEREVGRERVFVSFNEEVLPSDPHSIPVSTNPNRGNEEHAATSAGYPNTANDQHSNINNLPNPNPNQHPNLHSIPKPSLDINTTLQHGSNTVFPSPPSQSSQTQSPTATNGVNSVVSPTVAKVESVFMALAPARGQLSIKPTPAHPHAHPHASQAATAQTLNPQSFQRMRLKSMSSVGNLPQSFNPTAQYAQHQQPPPVPVKKNRGFRGLAIRMGLVNASNTTSTTPSTPTTAGSGTMGASPMGSNTNLLNMQGGGGGGHNVNAGSAALMDPYGAGYEYGNVYESPTSMTGGGAGLLGTMKKGKKTAKRQLVISGVDVEDVQGYEAVKAWCESLGEVREIKRVANGSLYVDFKKASVAETVCRLQAQVTIKGAGSVSLSWATKSKKKSI
ncbi:hypothetical protein CVT24_000636 [Panaeolus cyanescens]|uniref:Uncharacterized protein n=1 Tax=Panaeolus cyanescens TaxID=181874 RepID=A0A409YXZ9_9AGAR|nr:hypothetical protein CVT24_000636 [Panaeolus cyanescens]